MDRNLERILGLDPPIPALRDRDLPSLEEIADRYVLFLFRKTSLNIATTARILSISRSTLYGRLRRLGL
jgi:transcriptional regulator of acetoin/glycerol metabolism